MNTGLPAIVQCRPQRRLKNRGGGLQSVSRAVYPAKAFVCRAHVLDRTAVTAIAKMLSARGVESFHRRSSSCVAKLPVYSGLVPGASGFATGEGEAGAGHAKVCQGHAEFKGDEAQEGEQCICEPMWASPRQLVCADFVTDQVLPASTSGCGEGQAPDWRDADVTSVCLRRQGSAYTLSDSPCRAPRGGAREAQSFLHALQHLLATHGQPGPQQSTHRLNPGGSAKGKSKQSGREGTGKGGKNPAKERQAPSDASDADLLAALTRLVHRASVNGATGLRARLECLVMHAGEGKTLRSNRAERRRRAREKKRQTFYGTGSAFAPMEFANLATAIGGTPGHRQPNGGKMPRPSPALGNGKGKGINSQAWQVDRSLATISAAEAKRRLEEQKPLNADAIVVKNSSQAENLVNLAQVSAYKGQVAVISQEDLGDQARKVDVPCIKGDRRSVKQWSSVALTAEGCPAQTVLRKTSTFKPPVRDVRTLRVMGVREYMMPEIWQALKGSPAEVVARLLGLKHLKAESWKFQATQGEQVLVGYMSFEASLAQKALQLSGRQGLFVEPLARDQPQRPLVEWLQPGALSGVSYLQQAIQKSAGKPLAFRKGQGAALGVRCAKGEAVELPAAWRVRGVPKSWCAEDVLSALEGADFADASVIAPAEGPKPWLVRATLAGDTGALALVVEAGERQLNLERVVRRVRDSQVQERAWQPSRGKGQAKGKAAGTDAEHGGQEAAKETATSPMEVEALAAGGQQAATESAPDVAGTPAVVSGKRAREDQREQGRPPKASPPPWKEVECGGGGHCFYNSVTAGFILKTTGGSYEEVQADLPAKGRGLRSRLATFIAESPGKFKPFFHVPEVDSAVEDKAAALEHLRKIEDGDVPQTWAEYAKALYRPARYADEIAFRATTSLLGVSLCLVCGELANPSQVLHYRNEKSQICIYLRHSAGHYTFLLPHGDLPSYAKLPRDALPSQAFAPRGGGDDEQESWLQACDTSWIPHSASSPSAPTPESRDAGEAGSSDSSAVKHEGPEASVREVVVAAAGASVPLSAEGVAPRPKPGLRVKKGAVKVHWSTTAARARQQTHKVGKRKFGWRCDECKLRLLSADFESLRHLRNNHIRRVHKHVPKSRFSRLGPEPHRPIPAVRDCESPAWMCFHCRHFLPAGCHRRVKANSIARHIKCCNSCPPHWTPLKNLIAILEDQGIRAEGIHQARLARRFKQVDLQQYRPQASAALQPQRVQVDAQLKGGLQQSRPQMSAAVQPQHAQGVAQPKGVWQRPFGRRRRLHGKQEPRRCFVKDLCEDGDVESQPGPSSLALQLRTRNAQGFYRLVQGRRCLQGKQDPRRCFVKDLCEDGDVEPNPGPGSLAQQLLTWNAQGFNHLVQALHLNLFEGCDVVAIQEANLTQLNRTEIACMCERKGFHAYFRAAPESRDACQRPVCRGGLVTLVRHGLPSHRVSEAAVEGMYEILTVRVGRWQVHNAHRKPSSAPEAYEDVVQQLMAAPGPAVVLGDHNIDFGDFSFRGAKYAAKDDQDIPLPTRVDGRRCIDFLLCKAIGVTNTVRRADTLGDHYMITASAQLDSACQPAEPLWRARPTTNYSRPAGVSGAEWTKAQAVYWQNVEMPPDRGDTEDEWNWFNRQAESIMRQASVDCGSRPRDPPGRRLKGTEFDCAPHVAQPNRGSECHSFAVRRLLKLQGRLREWQRQEAAGRDTTSVQLAVQRSWPRSLRQQDLRVGVAPLLAAVAEALAEAQHRKTREDVTRWQRQMAERGKAATRWLRGKQVPVFRIAPHTWCAEDAVPSLSICDSLNHLRDFWRTIWVRQGCDHAAAVDRWRRFGRSARFSGCTFSLVGPDALHRAAQRKDHGAAGPDGWSGCEVHSWPRAAWNVYAQLLQRWLKRSVFPATWRQLRQVHIPKDSSAPDAAHQVKADELRPIAVLSILWRVISSAVAQHAHTQEWVSNVVDGAQYGGIHARHLHQGLGQLAAPFQSGAVVTALDLQKCFDFVAPGLVCAVMREAGFPPELLAALKHVWTQERFLEVGGYVLPLGEQVTEAMPQGDALAPLALNVLLSAPVRDVGSRGFLSFAQSVFLDDRACASMPDDVPRIIELWDSWSHSLGLRENRRKLAVVTRSQAARTHLHTLGLGHLLKSCVRVLGVDFTDSVHGPTPTADARFDCALAMGRRLLNRAIPLDIRRDLWRTRVVVKASWGHLLRPPREDLLKKFEGLFKQVVYSHRMGSVALRQILEGHAMHVGFASGIHCLRAWRKCGMTRALAQDRRAGTWFGNVVTFLQEHGWQHEAGVVFRSPNHRIDCMTDEPGHVDHAVRTQWRRMLHARFCAAERRDARALTHWQFNEAQTKKAIQLYQGATAEGKAVMLGAAHSTAFYDKRRFPQASATCRWCRTDVVPCWDHLVWQCLGLSCADLRPDDVPRPGVTRRLGWPEPHETLQTASARLRFMGCVRECVREQLGHDDRGVG